MIFVEKVSKSFGGLELFREVNWRINPGDRIGLVGPNGSGKTTLLRIIAGQEAPDSGRIICRKESRIGYLPQEVDRMDNLPLEEFVLAGASAIVATEQAIAELGRRMEALQDQSELERHLRELDRLQRQYDAADGSRIHARCRMIIQGLGFTEDQLSWPLENFSGGWRMRAALARLLLQEPDLLLLDEPTNHMDLASLVWLENILKEHAGSIVLVSHDRAFLEQVTQKTVALEGKGLRIYSGPYSFYVQERDLRQRQLEAAYRNQQKKIIAQERFIERFRAKNTKASQVKSRLKMMEKMERIEPPSEPPMVKFNFPQPPRSGREVITLSGVNKSYGTIRVYCDLEFQVLRGEKLALVGPNGAGKSTLLKILGDMVKIDHGRRKVGHNVAVAYFAQHHMETLHSDRTILEEVWGIAQEMPQSQVRALLGAFLFTGDDVHKKISVLSGGEKSRVALARLLIRPANLILMDEPTNNLDLPSCEVLEHALASFTGSLVFITHDRRLINAVATSVVEVIAGTLRRFPGNYDDYMYRKHQGGQPDHARIESKTPASAKSSGDGAGRTRNRRREKGKKALEAELRNRFYRETRESSAEVERVETELDAVSQRRREIQALYTDPATYDDSGRVRELGLEDKSLEERSRELMKQWESLQLQLEESRSRFEREMGMLKGEAGE